jgi:nucleoside deoxyribosyltransferase
MKIYFAGPDVFRTDYGSVAEKIKSLSKERGIVPLIPGDGNGPMDPVRIFEENIALIRESDGVIANMNPFRSPAEPDSGTAFEAGFAYALGKWVIAYLADRRDLIDKLRESPIGPPEGSSVCRDGTTVEDMRLPLNLMIAVSAIKIALSLEEAIDCASGLARP